VATGLVGGAMLLAFAGRLAGASPLRWALLTLGFGYVLRELAHLLFGNDFKLVGLPLEGTVPYFGGLYRVVITIASIALIAALALFLGKTRYGVMIRAIASNREAAQIAGVSSRKVYAWI